MLEESGLIYQEDDPNDKRITLIYDASLKKRIE
jgi:hypothetical protein